MTTETGVVPDLPEADYFSHSALSHSGAKLLLPPNCPALFQWRRTHPQEHKPYFDYGHAAHKEVLGVGADIVPVDADDWRSKQARELRDAAYAAGKTPLLAKDARQVRDMADAVRAHPLAAALLDADHGIPEASLFWHDPRHGIERRARLDFLPHPATDRVIVSDLKTTACAAPSAIRKTVANFGYASQAAWYTDAVQSVGWAEAVAFLFIFVEKTPPYLVTVCELDGDALQHGYNLNDQACATYARCAATNEWPAYSADVVQITLPPWAYRDTEDAAA